MKRLNRISPTAIFLFIVIIYFTGFFAHALYLKKTVYGDGVYYYSWLRSIVIDRDIRFNNEYRDLGGSQPMSKTGLIGNKYAIGPAIIWSPAFLLVHSFLHGDGYSLPYQLAVGLTSVCASIFGLLLLWRIF